jgi:hypothetical protein
MDLLTRTPQTAVAPPGRRSNGFDGREPRDRGLSRLRPHGRGTARALLASCCWLLVLVNPARAEVSREYQLKAAFLYNFTRFVEWPPQRFPERTSPIVIGVLGGNPFGEELTAVVEGRNVNGRKIEVRSLKPDADLSAVHILFFPAGETGRCAEIIEAAHRTGTLTVGESQPFATAGGIITFTLEGDRLRFAVNAQAVDRAGLKLSAQLLKLATTVRR